MKLTGARRRSSGVIPTDARTAAARYPYWLMSRRADPGARQDSCRLIHAAKGGLSVVRDVMLTTESRSGLSVTAPMGAQFRVWHDQRAGLRSRASTYSA